MDEFLGQFEHTIDDKGRLVLPAAYRAALADGGYVSFLGRYPALFTEPGWDRYRRRLEDSGAFSRTQLQYVLSFTSPFRPDSQHRVGLGAKLREVAGLEREVTIVGSGTHAALYPRAAWAAIEVEANAPDEAGRTLIDKFDSLDFL